MIYAIVLSLLLSANLFPNMTTAQEIPLEWQEGFTFNEPEDYITVSSVVETFDVTRDWVIEELFKGYALNDIYQGLQQQKDGNSYESYINAKYPDLQVKSATNTVYGPISVPEGVYLPVSITDEVYADQSLSLTNTKPYDEIALQRAPLKYDQAPYSVGTINDHISTADGSLRVEETDLVMPGVNGLDFALRRIYDSSRGKDDLTVYNDLNSTRSTREEVLFPLGKGWIWDISYIKSVEGQRYIYISGVGTFAISSRGYLLGYPWRNLSLGPCQDDIEVGGRECEYILADYTKGTRQYFDSSGRLIMIQDEFGNWLKFWYETNNYYGNVLSAVISSANDNRSTNVMTFHYNNDSVQARLGDRTVTYKKKKMRANSRDQEVLAEVIDPMGRSTKYDYTVWSWDMMLFNLLYQYKDIKDQTGRFINWGKNEWITLKFIEHPTKAMTKFGAYTVSRKIGRYAEEKHVRFSIREDFYSSTSSTIANPLYLLDIGDIGDKFGETSTFATRVSDDLTETIYHYKKKYVDGETPDVIYNTKTEIIVGNSNLKKVINYSYDESTNRPDPTRIEERTYNGSMSSPVRVTTRTYDNWGFLSSETNPIGATSRFQYNLVSINNRMALTNSTLPVNSTTNLINDYQYNMYNGGSLKQAIAKNNQGTLLQQLSYDYDNAGRPITVRILGDQRETMVNQEYSPRFHSMFLTKQTVGTTDVDGQVATISKEMEYNASTGEVTKFIDGKGNATSYTYDKLGRITAEIYPDGNRTTVEYDDEQNKVTVIDPVGIRLDIFYDPFGRKTKEINGRGETEYWYDKHGRVTLKRNLRGGPTFYEYDNLGRVVKEDFLFGTNQFIYDDIANTKTIIDAENNTIRETYDLLDRVIKKEEIKPTGNIVLAQYEYDYAGNVIATTDANGNMTRFEYDALSRLTAVTDAEGKTTRYRYNLTGDMVELQYADGNKVQKHYDEIGRLIRQIDPLGQTKKMYYDANSNISQIIDRKGQTQRFEYNNRDFLIRDITPGETITYSYDAAGKRVTMNDGTGTTNYGYYPTGELASLTYPDGIALTFDYEKRGLKTKETLSSPNYNLTLQGDLNYVLPRLNEMSVIGGNGAQLALFNYEYLDNSALRMISSSNGLARTFAYDGLNMVNMQYKKGDALLNQYVYSYDNNRNIIGKNENNSGFTFTYDALNRIKTSSLLNETYTYDMRDNRMTLTSDQFPNIKGASYVYDDRNRLTKVTTEDGKTVTYRYNGDGLMVERSENGATTRYYYNDSAKLIGEGQVAADGSVKIMVSYIHDFAGRLLARQLAGQNELQYYLTNGHGDVTEIRDESGNLLNQYTYDIWGNPLTEHETVPNMFRYSGEYWDQATNLQYLRARWYDPSIGRFITEDTYEGQITNPLSLNLYTYVSNNPLKYIDPTGHQQIIGTGGYGGKSVLTFTKPLREMNPLELSDLMSSGKVHPDDQYKVALYMFVSIISPDKGGAFTGVESGLNAARSSKAAKAAKVVEGCNCFTAGTTVLTDEGEKNIEDIEVGDKVLAKDDETGEMAYKEVEWLFQRDVEETYNITVGGEVITTTDEHPFWIVGKGWVESKNLEIGDVLTTSEGKELALEKIDVKKEYKTVYNFMVNDFHTYFVSNLGIWTHNACSIGTDFGKQGILANNPGIKVNWGNKTKHGFDRMLERGVTTDMVNDWVRTGKALSQDGGKKFLFVTKDGAAVVAKDGTLVTVMHKHDFDEKMQSLVNTLYGK
nr:polymorphic toxin-type HINT domain-containing protein [Paenibacillus sp. MSJ-34]